jgi:hypothetical protein
MKQEAGMLPRRRIKRGTPKRPIDTEYYLQSLKKLVTCEPRHAVVRHYQVEIRRHLSRGLTAVRMRSSQSNEFEDDKALE